MFGFLQPHDTQHTRILILDNITPFFRSSHSLDPDSIRFNSMYKIPRNNSHPALRTYDPNPTSVFLISRGGLLFRTCERKTSEPSSRAQKRTPPNIKKHHHHPPRKPNNLTQHAYQICHQSRVLNISCGKEGREIEYQRGGVSCA